MKTKTKTTAAVVAAAVGLTIVASGAGATAARMVTSKQIQNGTIKSIDVKDNNLKGRDIRDGSLTGADIRDGSLTVRDFSGSVSGPAGQNGQDGAAGAAGKDGRNGVDGASAYDLWLADGNTGTVIDFLDSLVGPAGVDGKDGRDGADGRDGSSAYDIWLAEGNHGTEQDFLASLVGAAGTVGPQGSYAFYDSEFVMPGAGTLVAPADPEEWPFHASFDLPQAQWSNIHVKTGGYTGSTRSGTKCAVWANGEMVARGVVPQGTSYWDTTLIDESWTIPSRSTSFLVQGATSEATSVRLDLRCFLPAGDLKFLLDVRGTVFHDDSLPITIH